MELEDFYFDEKYERPVDPKQKEAFDYLKEFFEQHNEEVFFSRQLEVQNESKYFHWITNRALRDLIETGNVNTEIRKLSWGGQIHLFWHKSYRYPRRKASSLVQLVEKYSSPKIGGLLGLHAEFMVLEGFSRFEFIRKGRNINEFNNKK